MSEKTTEVATKKTPRIQKGVQVLKRSSLDIPHLLCNHIIGKEHKLHHRITVGSLIMVLGVIISKSGGSVHILVIHYLLDTVGYLLHGIGAIPWIEHLTMTVEAKHEKFLKEQSRDALQLETLKEKEIEEELELQKLEMREVKEQT